MQDVRPCGLRRHLSACPQACIRTPPSPWHSDPTSTPASMTVPPRAGICCFWHLHPHPRHFHVAGSSLSRPPPQFLLLGASSWTGFVGQNSVAQRDPGAAGKGTMRRPALVIHGRGHESSVCATAAVSMRTGRCDLACARPSERPCSQHSLKCSNPWATSCNQCTVV